jgi:GNAT superfamily N-acetyltransferase
MRVTRLAERGDLTGVLDLYRHLNPNMPTLAEDRAEQIWVDTLSRKGIRLFVSTVEEKIVSSCLLVTAPNLMRGGAPYAFVENVITHGDFRRQGHGRATMEAALQAAWKEDCGQVMLMTARGRADPGVLRFYEGCGFLLGVKDGLVAWRPN